MNKYKLDIRGNDIYIGDTLINEQIFNEEMVNYRVRDREDFINELIGWIGEATTDKEIMKSDLIMLMDLEDYYIFSSISTNEYICQSQEPEEFINLCKEILELNQTIGIDKGIKDELRINGIKNNN